jgi:hypothetical protein
MTEQSTSRYLVRRFGRKPSSLISPKMLEMLLEYASRHPELVIRGQRRYSPKYSDNDSSPEAIEWRKRKLKRQNSGMSAYSKAQAREGKRARGFAGAVNYAFNRVVAGGSPGLGKRR